MLGTARSSSMPALAAAVLLLLGVILVFLAINTCGGKRHAYEFGLAEKPPTIFVSIASYRDSECPATVQSLFEKADHPERVFIGLCTQNAPGDPACPAVTCKACRPENIRTIALAHTEAKGPSFARYHCASLYDGEDYYLQIDSHMQFIQGWDTLLIEEQGRCKLTAGSKGGVLTHYPPANMTPELQARNVTTHICRGKFEPTGMISFLSNQFERHPHPLPTYYVASGFLFGPGSMVTDVPFDPHLDFLFWGEELLHAARLWTSGYDLFSPGLAVCSHSYERSYAKNVFADLPKWQPSQEASHNRVRYFLGWNLTAPLTEATTRDEEKYGMGKKRSLAEYMRQAEIDPATGSVGNTCLHKWVQ